MPELEPVVLALASNERYFPGLYCAVASALSYLNATRDVELKVLDGGISAKSKNALSHLVERFGRRVRLEFVRVDESIFRSATLGPGKSHMAYCRILLPQLLDVTRLVYLDCDVLVFRDLSELFEIELSPSKIIAAVPDSETLTLGDDSYKLASVMSLPTDARYFYSGVLLMNLDELREQHFFERAIEFLSTCSGDYRFHDQSAFNFLLHGRIDELPEHWNRVAWRFDQQDDNSLDCVLHYPSSPPWLGGTPGPAQVLFERFASATGMPVNRQTPAFKKSRRKRLLRNALAPFRALAFQLVSFLYKIAGEKEKCAAYQKVARYWLCYVLNAPRRLWRYGTRAEQIQGMKFKVVAFTSAP